MRALMCAAAAAVTLGAASPALSQEFYMGQIITVGFTYCPRGTLEASGQLLPISTYSAMFSLFGTIYGGDGRTTFALPDLRGRVGMHTGTGPGLPTATLGERIGTPTTTLTTNQMPSHSHALNASSGDPDDPSPNNALLGTFTNTNPIYSQDAADITMSAAAIGMTGGSQPFQQYQPTLVLRYCVVMEGLYPPRS